jgi:hypothetical protein
MKYKGIEYRILQTTTPGVWVWSVHPPKSVPIQGKSNGQRARAVVAAERAIDEWLKSNPDDGSD